MYTFYLFSLILHGSSICFFNFLIGKLSQIKQVFLLNLAIFLGMIWLMQEFKDWATRAHQNSGNPDGLCRTWKQEEFPISLFQSFSLKKTEQKPNVKEDLDKNLDQYTMCVHKWEISFWQIPYTSSASFSFTNGCFLLKPIVFFFYICSNFMPLFPVCMRSC